MADYFTQFAVFIDMPREAAAHAAALADLVDRYALHLALYGESEEATDFDGWSGDDRLDAAARIIAGAGENEIGATWVAGEQGLYVAGEENPNIEMIAEIVQITMQRFHLTTPVVIEWANFCSRPRPGGFSGGCAVITQSHQRWLNTGRWADRQIEDLRLDAAFQSA
jgi:hypothetical protein